MWLLMAKRSQLVTEESVQQLFIRHPYLLIFQKEDWQSYLILLGNIYDLLEEENVKVPYEVLRSLALRFFSQRKLIAIDGKIIQFFGMAIGELQVLKDSHDQFGNRFVETTRGGKELLQLTENLLSSRVKYSGTGAETVLATLNDILLSRERLSAADAINLHKEKIQALREDIRRIETRGVEHAQMLPVPHSNEALFNQAEESAIHLLAAIEDVKSAIEKERQALAQEYFEQSRSAGQNLNTISEFYEALYRSPEYESYNQAKHLISHLGGAGSRFQSKDIDGILYTIMQRDLLPVEKVQRSNLKSFAAKFQSEDNSIQEKIKSQIKLLQQQVYYAISTDLHGLQDSLHSILSQLFIERERAVEFFVKQPVALEIPVELEMGELSLFGFEKDREIEQVALTDFEMNEQERRALFLALLQSEEVTLQSVLGRFCKLLREQNSIDLVGYPLEHGLAEYYVLSEIELFDRRIEKTSLAQIDLSIPTKYGDFVLRGVPSYRYTMKENHGIQ